MQRPNVDRKVGYIIAALILAASLIVLILPVKYLFWAAALLFLIAAPAALVLIKKRSIHSFNKRQVFIIVTVIAALYVSLYYLSGIYFGFASSPVRLTLNSLISNVLPIILVIILSELVRAPLIAEEARLLSVLAYVICVLADVMTRGGAHGINTAYLLADFFGTTLFPAIISNLFFIYITKRYGILPNISYRLILTLYAYIIPVVPNAPAIMPAFALMMLPIISYKFIDALFEKRRRLARDRKSKFRFIIPSIMLAALIAFILLVSCKFRYGIVVIATSSMADEINVGDAVVYEAFEDADGVSENDVIIFSKDGKIRYVHRIVEINEVDGQPQYVTKGDANENPDPGFVTDSEIIGVVRFKVIYLGYPSLWLRDIFD